MAPSKMAPRSGLRAYQSKTGSPKWWRKALSPLRTLWSRSVQASSCSPPSMRVNWRREPGWSLRSSSARGVSTKRRG